MDKETEELFKKMAEQFIKLIESNNFLLQENLRLMKNTSPNLTYPIYPTNPATITPGQIDYIKTLQQQGKIPQSQRFDISKAEAQILIHNAVNSKEIRSPNPLSNSEPELKELYEEAEDY